MKRLALVAALLFSVPAHAQDEGPRFCPNRPDLGQSACTTDPGRVLFEISAVDWTLAKDDATREDRLLAGDFQARFGLTATSELQIAWSPYGHVRTRDRATGATERSGRVGDVVIGFRQNLRNPDGNGLSYSIQPQVSLPVGRAPVGAGTWGAGLVVPLNYDLSGAAMIGLTSEIEAAPDEDGRGRHFAISETLGLGYELSDRLTAIAEIQIEQDNDPAGHETRALAAGSLAWQPRHGLQFDVLVGAGLTRDFDDVRILTGGAILF